MTSVPFEFFDLHVERTVRISPAFVRVTFGGTPLARLTAGGLDQRVKLFLPRPGQSVPVLPRVPGTGWFPLWRAMDPTERAVMRSYTVRDQRRSPQELDIDFALHGGTGPASRWARAARPGDRVTILGPVEEDNRGIDFRPPAGTDWLLLAGDETALPAVAGILAQLAVGSRAVVWMEVPRREDRQEQPTKADVEISWLFRKGGPNRGAAPLVPSAVRAAELPAGTPYAWIAGEAGSVRTLRRHLVNDRGFARDQVTFSGYWRRGITEDEFLAQAARPTEPARTVQDSGVSSRERQPQPH